MTKPTLLLCTALTLALPLAARASEQPITVTATRIPTPADAVPAGVTILTRADFAAQGDTTLAQALSAVPGVNIVQAGGPGNATSLFMRGTGSEDVLVLLDGVPVNDPAEPNGAFNFGVYTLADVERIEIVRGPMSGLYGGNAIGGVINIITRRGAGKPRADITLGGGWPAQGQGSATVSGVSGRFDYALSAALNEQAGFDATPKRMSVYAGHRAPYRAKLAAAQVGYALSPQTRLYLILRAQQTDAAFPDLGYPIYDDPTEFDYNTNLFGKLGLSSSLLDGRWHTELFVARLQTRLHNKNLLDTADPNQASANDHYDGARTDVQWNNTLRLPDAGPFNLSSALFGVEYSNDSAREAVNETNYGFPYTSHLRASQHLWAGHAGLQTTLAQRLTLTAALRDDSVSSFGNAITWRLGGVFALPAWHANLKAAVGTGFLAPSLFDLHYVSNYGTGNPNLRPEYSTGWEAGVDFSQPGFGQADFISGSVSYFANSIRDLIQSVTLPGSFTSTEENVARAQINGVETNLTLRPADWLSATLTYTYTRARSRTSTTPLLRRPRNVASLSATLRPVPALSLTPQLRYVGRFYDTIYNDSGYYTGIGSSDPGTIFNLTARYRLNARFTLFADGRNILNSRFEPQNGLQMPGASLLLGIHATLQ